MEEIIVKETVSIPRIGSPAPSFEAVTTLGVLRLEDLKAAG